MGFVNKRVSEKTTFSFPFIGTQLIGSSANAYYDDRIVCKHSVDEFLNELVASNSKDILKLGHVLQPSEHQKTITYKTSELRLIEALENTCKNLRNYKVHKDKHNHLRYSKDESATFKTLNDLKKRGVKVDLGFPDEMWDTPDAEVVKLKTKCENMIEEFEDDISEWYYKHQKENLYQWLCGNRVLKGGQINKECLPDLSEVTEKKIKDEKLKKEEAILYDNNGSGRGKKETNSGLKDKLSEHVEL